MYLFPPDLKTGKVYENVKLVLQIDFIKKYELKIRLINIDKNICGLHNKSNVVYNDPKFNFTIWSYNFFYFGDNEIRFPDRENLHDGIIEWSYNFLTERKRYLFLKILHITLNDFSTKKDIFPNNFNKNNEDNIIISDNFWMLK
jgi:hypothetical protein